MLLVAALAVVFSILMTLQRRSERFRRLAAEYASAIHTVYFADMDGEDGVGWTAAVADYHADLSAKYTAAAKRPWLPLESEPPQPDRIKAFWSAHEAVKKAYPGLALSDYNVMVTVDDSEDQAVWAVQYRRRDNRSRLTVYLRDPIEIKIHSEGPPPAQTIRLPEGVEMVLPGNHTHLRLSSISRSHSTSATASPSAKEAKRSARGLSPKFVTERNDTP